MKTCIMYYFHSFQWMPCNAPAGLVFAPVFLRINIGIRAAESLQSAELVTLFHFINLGQHI